MLILASASPRRQELLKEITPDFIIMPADVDEDLPAGIAPREAVALLAARKAEAVAAMRPGDAVIGADTVVAIDGEILGKPRDAAHAAAMLRKLSGRRHGVLTGVCVIAPGGRSEFVEITTVTFRTIPEDKLLAYANSPEPLDKAGAYAIQGGAAAFVGEISGETSNVVGLPVAKLDLTLKTMGLI